ncbi:polycystic kidney disease protein 1-like 2 [Lingula anatina]|uniref:Polycystic kidney disease protein 1-like 2 n=1 Tax=Lingula anatina TaxID=7574 RepID=A0A1S3JEM0_LINAN|nr:polycystic kidney disease protein 1-like 2 [Lingula anatina]|eukprot:XP_013408339.1 polycystic kidney disease protein 1-like 2 [Lingula anatina]
MVISLPDNDPLATYTYTVSVFTGSRRGSGTSANITITLIGSNGESDPHLLSSPQRSKIFGQRGAVDFFIIKTAASLGEVKKIRLWHDNSGSDPAWFLSRVVIHDLKADQKFYFICHSWLAVDLGDGQVDQVFSNATDDDIRNFTHLFISKTKIGLTDGHLWFSIFARPTISHFTCVQRLSCCLCLLMTTMLTNIMFYQVDTGPTEKAVDLGTVKLTWSQFIIGVESALFMFPISILIVELFRLSKAKPSALETSWSDTNLDQQDDRHTESNVKYGKLKNISSIELEFKSPVESAVSLPAGSDEGALRSVVSDASTGFKSPIQSDQSVVPPGVQMEQSVVPPGGNYGRPDTPLHSFPLQSSSTYQSIVTNASSLSITAFKSPYPSTDEMGCTLDGHTVDARSFKSVISGGPSYGKLGDRPATVQFHQEVEIIGGEGSQFPEDESANITPSDNEVRSVEDVDIEIDPNWAGKGNKGSGSKYFAQFKDEEGDQGTGGAPGQHFQDSPKDQEEEDDILPEYAFEAVSPDGMLPWWFIYIGWAFVGLTTLSCGFFTILYGLSYGFRTSISWVVSMLTSFFTSVLFIQPVKVIGLAVFFSLVFKMPDEAETVIDPKLVDALEHFGKEDSEKIQQIQLHLNQLRCDPRYKPPAHKTLKSAKQLRYQQKRMYAIIREVIGYIIYCWLLMLMAYGQRDPQVYYLNKSLTDLFVPNFMQVKTFDDFWVYVKDTAITNLYDQEDPGFLTTKAAYLVGSPRLLQIRVKGGTCKSPIGALAHMICASTYGPDTADKTSYNQSWQAPLMNGSVSADNLPWVYQTPAELQYMWQSGILGEYGHWGGYVADLGRTVEGATSLVQSLQDATWLNEGTRMVVLEFTAYNANVNQFTMISTLVEVSVGGGLVLTPTVSSMRLYRYLQQFNLFVMACEIIYCIYVLYFIVAECMALKERGWSYFISGWTWISISLISVSLAGIGTYIARSIVTIAVMERFKRDPSAFVNFEQTVLLDKALGYLIAVLVMLSSLKFISILRFNPVVHLLTQTFAKAAGQILWAVALVVAYFIAYAFLSNLIFGRHLYYFRNFRVSMESMFGFIRGGYDIEAMQEVHWLVAPFILMSFVIVVIYVFLALFIAILTSEIGVERQYGGPQEDADLIRLGIEKVRELLGLGRQKK